MTVEALLVYDVQTTTTEGQRRLREVARICEGLGRRVQNSVFEIECTPAQLITIQHQLQTVMHPGDNIRLYRLHRGTLNSVESLGSTPLTRVERDVIL